jgi:DNA-binding SARP family transcriptional activator
VPRLTLTLLGGFEARLDQGDPLHLPRKSQALLAYLALHPRRACTRAEAAALLWSDFADDQARGSLRKALVGLRKAFGRAAPGMLEVNASIGFAPDALGSDAATFRRLIATESTTALEQAAALYRGDFLRGLDVDEAAFEEWLSAERERFRNEALIAFGTLVARHLEAAAYDAAIDAASRLLAIEPGHEPAHRALMRVYAATGRRAAALRQYQRCVEALQHDLGIEPSPETRAMYQQIVRTPAAPPPPAEHDAGDVASDAHDEATPFVGRAGELIALRSALADAARGRAQIVAILGEAGIGKTRLLAHAAADAAATGARVVVGHAYPSEQIVPCAPWIDAFGAAAIGASDDAGRLADAVVALVERHTTAQPLVLVFEDLHWADELSVRLIGVVARRLRARHLLVVLSARDDELDDRPALRDLLRDLKRASPVSTMTLAPLSAAGDRRARPRDGAFRRRRHRRGAAGARVAGERRPSADGRGNDAHARARRGADGALGRGASRARPRPHRRPAGAPRRARARRRRGRGRDRPGLRVRAARACGGRR